MSVRVEIVPATCEHAYALAGRLRAADREEVLAAAGLGPLEALLRSLEVSEAAGALLLDGQVAAIWGIGARRSVLAGGLADAWLLTGDAIDRHPVTFWRLCRREVRRLLGIYGGFTNAIDARHEQALRWARRLGFRLEPAHPFGVAGLPFHRFTFREEDLDV